MSKKINIKRLCICLISIVALVVIDQLTKVWAVNTLKDKAPIQLINNVLELHYLPNGNTGAAFGMLQGKQWLFLIIAIVISLGLLFVINSFPDDKKYRYAIVIMTFIIAGGIGNMIDRISLKYVIDFIYISIINFPIFNVADMYVSVGTFFLIILSFVYYKEEDFAIVENAFKNLFKMNK